MKPNPSVTTTARILAGLLALHLLILRPPAELLLPVIAVLLAGEILRVREVFLPARWGALFIATGVVTSLILGVGMRPAFLLEGAVGMAGAMAILSRLTPTRGLWILFCLLILLLAIVLTPFAGIGGLTVIGDVVVLFLTSERVRRPPEVLVSFWASLLRSLRVVVPVALVVSTVFWLFPNLSLQASSAFTGFSGRGDLSPGGIASLAQSHRVAMVARFPEDHPLPTGADLYWRGQVLSHNAGLRWTDEGSHPDQKRTLLETAPATNDSGWNYHLNLAANHGGIVPVLDHALFVEARRTGVEVAIFDRGAAVLNAVGRGALSIEAMSSSEPMNDAPVSGVAEGDRAVPETLQDDTALRELTQRLIHPDHPIAANLASLAAYFRDGGFIYSLRPGRVKDLPEFLFEERRGFCGHYAATAANLLRLGGIPTRIVTGFRGGEWNPWLRTLTIRDSDAHAWVEAWDAQSLTWYRFDPTDAVAPDETARIAANMNPASWPWYRRGWSYGQAQVTVMMAHLKKGLSKIMSFEVWEYVQPVLSGVLFLIVLAWAFRKYLQRAEGGALERLELRAIGSTRARLAGETPLAWMTRLTRETENPLEKTALQTFATAYESRVYRAVDSLTDSDLRRLAKHLLRLWRVRASLEKRDW